MEPKMFCLLACSIISQCDVYHWLFFSSFPFLASFPFYFQALYIFITLNPHVISEDDPFQGVPIFKMQNIKTIDLSGCRALEKAPLISLVIFISLLSTHLLYFWQRKIAVLKHCGLSLENLVLRRCIKMDDTILYTIALYLYILIHEIVIIFNQLKDIITILEL